MRTDAYIDTNIYVYVALRNRAYFEKCRLILRDALSGRLTAYGSPMVAVELLGSLSRVDPVLAREALRACLAMPLRSLELTQAAPGSSAPFTDPRAPLAGSWVAHNGRAALAGRPSARVAAGTSPPRTARGTHPRPCDRGGN